MLYSWGGEKKINVDQLINVDQCEVDHKGENCSSAIL